MEKIKGQISSSSLIPVYMSDTSAHCHVRYICPLSMCVPSFNLLGITVPEKNMTKILMFENW